MAVTVLHRSPRLPTDSDSNIIWVQKRARIQLIRHGPFPEPPFICLSKVPENEPLQVPQGGLYRESCPFTKACRGSGVMAPLILSLGTRWRSVVVEFTPGPLYFGGKLSQYTLNRGLGGSENRCGCFEKENNLLLLPGFEQDSRSYSQYRLNYPISSSATNHSTAPHTKSELHFSSFWVFFLFVSFPVVGDL
jgi:hypothetical protein